MVHQLDSYPPLLSCSPGKASLTWITCREGANGGLGGSDVRVLSKSSRKCTVTGIDQHQINGLDIVQCVALANSNHGYISLIMNEYAYYGKGQKFTLLVKLNGTKTKWMTNLLKWVVHNASPPWMDIPCHCNVQEASCT